MDLSKRLSKPLLCFFTCLGEKKEVTDPGIRSCPLNVGVAQLCQVMDLSIYTQTSVPIG